MIRTKRILLPLAASLLLTTGIHGQGTKRGAR